jgi:alkylation response protein AidB-like acyl-CoA dehydrogenase
MDFSFTPEQRELGAVLRAFLADRWPETEVRRLLVDRSGWDRATWDRCATEIGVPALAIPERFGGAGYGVLELGVVFEELGRALVGSPFLASVGLATTALLACDDDEVRAEYLPGLASGATVAALVPAVDDLVVGDGVLSGSAELVLDGGSADLLVVATADRGLFLVDPVAGADRVVRTPLDTVDPTRPQARIELREAPGRRVRGDAAAAVRRALDTATVLLAAEQVGGAARVLELAVEYAKVRHQFGRPIGSFQAVKHRCADMLLRVEAARSASAYALWVADARPDELPVAAAVAGSYCAEAYTFCAEQCVQIHGGIGFTWEHPASLHLRRARSGRVLFGTPAEQRAELANRLGI